MKQLLTTLFALILLLALSACSNQTDMKKSHDRIEVYDNNQNLVLETDRQEDLDYFSNLISSTVDSMEKEDFPFVKLSKDAQVLYEYRFITEPEDGKKTEVQFYVYENDPYITLKGIPILSPLTWEVSDEEYEKLRNPEN